METKPPPSKEELLRLIAEQQAEPGISALPYPEQQDFVLNPEYPLRHEMKRRDRLITEGLKHHKLDDPDLDMT